MQSQNCAGNIFCLSTNISSHFQEFDVAVNSFDTEGCCDHVKITGANSPQFNTHNLGPGFPMPPPPPYGVPGPIQYPDRFSG